MKPSYKNIETYRIIQDKPNDGVRVLYERYGKKFFNYAMKSWNLSDDEAWDIVYQTLYKIMNSISKYSFENEAKFRSFIFVLFCNGVNNYYNKKKRIRERFQTIPFNELLFDESGENPNLRTERLVQKQITEQQNTDDEDDSESTMTILLREVLDEMEPWERILLIQRSHGTPYKQISEYIDKPENQLKVYHQRLRKKLIDLLNNKIKANQKDQCKTKKIKT